LASDLLDDRIGRGNEVRGCVGRSLLCAQYQKRGTMRHNRPQRKSRGRKQRRAVVIGGSVGGLFIANMLIRRGWDVDIFERVEGELASRGAGIARHHEMIAIMAAAGVDDNGELGIAVDGRTAFDKSGQIIARFDYQQHLTAWSQVYNQLQAAFPRERYHLGEELVGIDSSGAAVVARSANRAKIEADLIVGADGFRSTVRSLIAPETVPLYAGYVAWRGLMAETDLSDQFRSDTFSRFSFCFPLKSQFIGYPLLGPDDSTQPGRRRYSFLWYYPVEDGDALTDVLTDEDGRRFDYSIPPPLIRRSHIVRLQNMARELLPPRFAEVVMRATQYMVQPIYDVESKRIGFKNVALLGDAAFVARPHVGVGVLKAGQDALALADALSESASVAEGLARYEAIRLPCGREAVRLGRHLGAFIERRLPSPWADPSLHLTVESIIRVSARPVDQNTWKQGLHS
jgi:2-polyprenyl-6-methoxyphenol hydroxylase-like FAD-dependent oxidoreductase